MQKNKQSASQCGVYLRILHLPTTQNSLVFNAQLHAWIQFKVRIGKYLTFNFLGKYWTVFSHVVLLLPHLPIILDTVLTEYIVVLEKAIPSLCTWFPFMRFNAWVISSTLLFCLSPPHPLTFPHPYSFLSVLIFPRGIFPPCSFPSIRFLLDFQYSIWMKGSYLVSLVAT